MQHERIPPASVWVLQRGRHRFYGTEEKRLGADKLDSIAGDVEYEHTKNSSPTRCCQYSLLQAAFAISPAGEFILIRLLGEVMRRRWVEPSKKLTFLHRSQISTGLAALVRDIIGARGRGRGGRLCQVLATPLSSYLGS